MTTSRSTTSIASSDRATSSTVPTTGKVFGIGFNKTATKSLCAACEQLGLRTLHDSHRVSHTLDSNYEKGLRLLDSLEDYDAYFDLGFWSANIPYVDLLRQLDRGYPDSRFILHTRNVDGWVRSRRAHRERKNTRTVIRRLLQRAPPRATGPEWETEARKLFAECHEAALARFRGRPRDLLVFDATAGHGWPELCSFLGRPVPTDSGDEPLPFPHRGKTQEISLYRRRYYPLLRMLRRLEERFIDRDA